MPPDAALSIVMPVYNEAPGLERVVDSVRRAVAAVDGDVEIVIVDDASTDATADVLDALAAGDARVHVHHAFVNRGHGPSVVHALGASRGAWILQMDSDGRLGAGDFGRLWSAREGADMVAGYRVGREDPRHRLALTWLEARIVRVLAGGRALRDVNAPFKLLRRDVWEDLRPAIPPAAAVPSIMLLLGAAVRGRRIVQVPVTQQPRLQGSSTLRPWRLARLCLRAAGGLLAYRVRLRRLEPRGAVTPDAPGARGRAPRRGRPDRRARGRRRPTSAP